MKFPYTQGELRGIDTGKLVTLLKDHATPEDAIPLRRIVSALGIEDDKTYRKTRLVIESLVEQGVPVGSTGAGFFYVTTEADLRTVTRNLYQRADETYERARKLEAAFYGGLRGAQARKRAA